MPSKQIVGIQCKRPQGPGSPAVFVPNCYYAPSREVRAEWASLALETRVRQEAAWYAKVLEDGRDERAAGREEATGIEMLGQRHVG